MASMKRTTAYRIARTVFGLGTLALILSAPLPASAQYFGRNKVQYENRDFWELPTLNWTVYFYAEESEAIEDIARMAERWYERFSRVFQHEFERRKPLIIYADHPDFQQTNTITGAIGQGVGGVTESMKDRVIMPLAPAYRETDRILGHELVHAFQFNIAKSASSGGAMRLFQMPLWVVEGMAEYLSMGRDHPHTAMWLRDHILRDEKPTLKEITRNPKYFAYRFGQGFISYLGGTYGDDAVQDFFRSALRMGWEGAIEYEFRMREDSISMQWWDAVETAYRPLMAGKTDPYETGDVLLCVECGAGRTNVAPSLSPDGRYIVFQSEKDLFSMDLYLADVGTGEILRALRRNQTAYIDGIRFIDSSGSWSPDSRKLAFIITANGDNQLGIVDVQSGRLEDRIEIEGLGALQNPAWSPDGTKIALTGLKGGISDLYLYDLETGDVRQLTNDKHADLQASWSPDGSKLVFVSDRGPGTNFDELTFGEYILSFLDLETLAVNSMTVFAGSKHINPIFDHTGEGLYFVSDPDGFPDVYHMRLADGEMRRITRAATGVSGITASSPAFSYAPGADLLAFSVFHERGYIVNTAYARDMATLVDVVADGSTHPGRLLPPGRPSGRSRVAGYLDDQFTGLVADDVYTTDQAEPYDPSLQLDFIGQPSVGPSPDPYGTYGVGGGTYATFSDMLGDRSLGVALSVNGGVRDIGAQAFYLNQKKRWNWGLGAQHMPYLMMAVGFDPNSFAYVVRKFRITVDGLNGLVAYPLSGTRRLELTGGLTRYSYHLEEERLRVNRYGQVWDVQRREIPTYDPVNLASAGLAFVGDNSYVGFTSPVRGERFRLGIETTNGTMNYRTMTADYRRYFNNGGPFTLAVRGLHLGRYGDTGGLYGRGFYPFFLGNEYFMRGYAYRSFDIPYDCTPSDNSPCPEWDRLFGHRVGVVNAEFRLPITGIEEFGLFDFPYLPTELTFFADMGVSWDSQFPATWKWSRTDPRRIPVASTGASLRINILGALIFEMYYAYPWQRPGKGWVRGFSLMPGW
ncbi:MAG: BamA/TamA family outer membrane protein [Gemmatimonadetes bacterium]|nr:BamA/TamA family outer membrane protein [Gemmatimonadota bacterium]MYB99771.1 BamA/TamA family outer membrane protein [Gemmatimonadota bacterium]MYI46127.1 BamA/TamA family outer membrane protein [Gemmatimonadota bacterium]